MKRFVALLACVLFIPLLSASQAQADTYRVKAGDVLKIEVLEDATLNRSSLVPPDGRITLPLAGSVAAAGRSIEAIQSDLIKRLTPSFAATPNVFVSIESIYIDPKSLLPQVIRVYVTGEASRQGGIDVKPGTTILQFISEMGGFTRFAAIKRIQLRRVDNQGAEKVYGINYDDIQKGLSSAGNTVLKAGDVIIVPQRKLFE